MKLKDIEELASWGRSTLIALYLEYRSLKTYNQAVEESKPDHITYITFIFSAIVNQCGRKRLVAILTEAPSV